MCLFSRAVREVGRTRIFARAVDPTRQLLVYAMRMAADEDVAMILPVPVPPGSGEDAVRFVDMSSCPRFFDDLEALFPQEQLSRGVPMPSALKLVVHDVGDFEASFVPTLADFGRLDERFRLPSDVWTSLPAYADWGFCVFKLREPAPPPPAGAMARVRSVFGAPPPQPARDRHPMAFELPRRDPSQLFFPTVHVHDGTVHPTADFDHTLYCQASVAPEGWRESPANVGDMTISPKATPWLDTGARIYRHALSGRLPNRDVFVPS